MMKRILLPFLPALLILVQLSFSACSPPPLEAADIPGKWVGELEISAEKTAEWMGMPRIDGFEMSAVMLCEIEFAADNSYASSCTYTISTNEGEVDGDAMGLDLGTKHSGKWSLEEEGVFIQPATHSASSLDAETDSLMRSREGGEEFMEYDMAASEPGEHGFYLQPQFEDGKWRLVAEHEAGLSFSYSKRD